MSNPYRPPYTIAPAVLWLVGEIGRYSVAVDASLSPRLRRVNRIRTIHASLVIENNTLTLAQMTAVLDGKRVMGLPREIQEVCNAFAAYECIDRWVPAAQSDLLRGRRKRSDGRIEPDSLPDVPKELSRTRFRRRFDRADAAGLSTQPDPAVPPDEKRAGLSRREKTKEG